MRLSNTPPAGAGQVRHTTKTERLLQIVEGLGTDANFLPRGIRTAELADRAGIPRGSVHGMLAPYVASGRLCLCKITIPGSPAQNEYRKGSGTPPPEFKPLNTKRNDVALRSRTPPGATAPLSTPRPSLAQIETPTLTKQPQPAVGSATPAAGDLSPPQAEPVVAAPATPKPDAGAALKKEPAAQKAPAGDDFGITLDDTGVLIISTDEGVIELQPQQSKRLGHFMVGSERIWNPF